MFNFDALIDSLPIMGLGMLGIFMVIGLIMLVIWILGMLFPENKDKQRN